MKKRKIVTLFTIIFIIMTLISVCHNFIMPIYPLSKLQKQIGSSSSVEIIGSADGPTALYITKEPSLNVFIVTFALLSVAGVLYLSHIKKSEK